MLRLGGGLTIYQKWRTIVIVNATSIRDILWRAIGRSDAELTNYSNNISILYLEKSWLKILTMKIKSKWKNIGKLLLGINIFKQTVLLYFSEEYSREYV